MWPCQHVSVSKGLLVIQIEICGQFLKFIALPFYRNSQTQIDRQIKFCQGCKILLLVLHIFCSKKVIFIIPPYSCKAPVDLPALPFEPTCFMFLRIPKSRIEKQLNLLRH